MRSITVLLVGQVRNQHVLLRMSENLAVLRDKGLVDQVILSTWTNEILKIRDLLPQLDAAGVTVKWVDEPVANLSAPGNIVNQMRGVDLALETVEDTAWILRARPDLWVDFDLVACLVAADMSLDEPGGAALTHSNSKSAEFVEISGFANQQKSDSGLGCSCCRPFFLNCRRFARLPRPAEGAGRQHRAR